MNLIDRYHTYINCDGVGGKVLLTVDYNNDCPRLDLACLPGPKDPPTAPNILTKKLLVQMLLVILMPPNQYRSPSVYVYFCIHLCNMSSTQEIATLFTYIKFRILAPRLFSTASLSSKISPRLFLQCLHAIVKTGLEAQLISVDKR